MAQRRRFTPTFKAQVVLELISGTRSQADSCRQYNLKPQMVSKWKTEFLEKAPVVFQTREQSSEEQVRIAELERMVGRLTLVLPRKERWQKKPQFC